MGKIYRCPKCKGTEVTWDRGLKKAVCPKDKMHACITPIGTFTFTEVCSESAYSLRRWSFKRFREAKIGERLERNRYRRAFENVLRQCQETMKSFEGSEETLRHIQRVEESLKKLATDTN